MGPPWKEGEIRLEVDNVYFIFLDALLKNQLLLTLGDFLAASSPSLGLCLNPYAAVKQMCTSRIMIAQRQQTFSWAWSKFHLNRGGLEGRCEKVVLGRARVTSGQN